MAWLVDLYRTVYPHKWSPVHNRWSAGQGKFAGQRPTFYRCATQPRGHTMRRLVQRILSTVDRGRGPMSKGRMSAHLKSHATMKKIVPNGVKFGVTRDRFYTWFIGSRQSHTHSFRRRGMERLAGSRHSCVRRHSQSSDSALSPVHTSNNVEATFDFVEATFNFVATNYCKISSFRQS